MGEVGTFTKGAPLSKADISEEGTPFILYGELYTTYSEVTTAIVRKTDKQADLSQYSHIGDVIIPTSGETPEEIATATCVMLPNVILAGDLNIFRGTKVDGRIISYIINHIVNQDISRIAQGKSVVHIKADELSKIRINYPESAEQKKLIRFLEILSARIEKQRQLVELLKSYKRGVLQSIFSGSSFCGKTAEKWAKKSIAEIFDCIIDKGHPEADVLTIIQGLGTTRRDAGNRRISYDKSTVATYKKVVPNDFILHLRSFEGGLEIANETGVVSPAYTILRSKYCISPQFYYAYFRSYAFIKGKLRTAVEGIRDGKSINMDTFWKITIPSPPLEEQERFAKIFAGLDTAINQANIMLDKLDILKRGLLDKLFI